MNEIKKTTPMQSKEDVAKSNDHKIDEDVKGYPHLPSTEKMITPKTETEKKTASIDITDGEKKDKKEIDEQKSDESAGAFIATEDVNE